MKKNKVVILFLVKFFVVYFLLTSLYSFYLSTSQETTSVFACAPVTNTVSNHAQWACELLGYDIVTFQNPKELSVTFLVNDKIISKIVEGCTSISIMILFLAFITAFSGTIKNTLWFSVIGLTLIYTANIFRIVFLTLVIYHYPELSNVLHDIVFPGIIYGMVFILWIIWVKKYAIINKK
ncbi:MAG: exosortase family protein XrtF [Flavobacteriaceae bacterium]